MGKRQSTVAPEVVETERARPAARGTAAPETETAEEREDLAATDAAVSPTRGPKKTTRKPRPVAPGLVVSKTDSITVLPVVDATEMLTREVDDGTTEAPIRLPIGRKMPFIRPPKKGKKKSTIAPIVVETERPEGTAAPETEREQAVTSSATDGVVRSTRVPKTDGKSPVSPGRIVTKTDESGKPTAEAVTESVTRWRGKILERGRSTDVAVASTMVIGRLSSEGTTTAGKAHKVMKPSRRFKFVNVTTVKSIPVASTVVQEDLDTIGVSGKERESYQIVTTASPTTVSSTASVSLETSVTEMPRVEATKSPSTGPRWILDRYPSQFCNKNCFPNVAISKYVCVIGYGPSEKRIDDKECKASAIPCGEKSFSCLAKPCGSWKMKKILSKCNATCGYGYQEQLFSCQINATEISEQYCLMSKRPSKVQKCFTEPCGKVTWFISRWSKCVGKTCQGIRTRIVVCRDLQGNIIPDETCKRVEGIPARMEMCMKKKCEKDFWYRGDWSKCSSECGEGSQKRDVVCVRRTSTGKLKISNRCDYRQRPQVLRKCQGNSLSCVRWMSSIVWHTPKPCSDNCTSTRRVYCANGTRIVSPTLCEKSKRPISSKPCRCLITGRAVKFIRSSFRDAYTEAVKTIRLSEGEILRTDLYWTCPPQNYPISNENYVWVNVRNQTRVIYRNLQKRSFEIKKSERDGRLVLKLRGGSLIPHDLTGHYLCIGYNNSQSMWDGQVFHRTIGYYKTRMVTLSEHLSVHATRAGYIVRLVCPLTPSQPDDEIQWLRNGKRLLDARGTEHQEFMKSVGKLVYECRSLKSKHSLRAAIRIDPMRPNECSSHPFGCCAQGYVPATTQLHEECAARSTLPCETSRYGCCPKEKVSAIGRLHLACKNRYIHPSRCSVDSQILMNAVKRCSRLPVKKGMGQLRYHLDVTTKRCLPFVFDTECTHVKNVPLFVTPENCRSQCIIRNSTERCKFHVARTLKEDKCPSPTKVWYYDLWTKECQPLRTPQECLLNSNRFYSQTECNRECKYSRYTRNPTEECFQPKAEGTCRKYYGYEHHYFYDYTIGQCKKFTFSGCHGTSNRFTTLNSCEDTCKGKATAQAKKKICSLQRDQGYCPLSPLYVRRWYHDPRDGICKEMQYTQCGGNGNNFENQKACIDTCGGNMTIDVCSLRYDKGDCPSGRNFRRYYFDWHSKRCRRFNYTGCGGNPNNFLNMRECNKACISRTTLAPTQPPVKPRKPKQTIRELDYEPCQMPQAPGNCLTNSRSNIGTRRGVDRWYFNVREGTCQSFQYSGCRGNANIYDTRFACEQKCEERLQKVPRQCKRKLRGSCLGVSGGFSVYTYDTAMGKCINKRLKKRCEKRLRKYFTSLDQCQSVCQPPPPTENQVSDTCYVNPQTYLECPEYQRVQRWAYNVQQKMCISYTTCPYTEYFGNSHANQSECQRLCMPAYVRDICVLPKDTGRCSTNKTRKMFYYNAAMRVCEPLWYNGCLGNKNRFVTLKECRSICETEMQLTSVVEPTPIKPNMSLIEQKPEFEFYGNIKMPVCNVNFTRHHLGTCKDDITYMERWYFAKGKCTRFHYHGCGALVNFFDTRFDCEDHCLRRANNSESSALAVQSVCHLPPFSGKCRQYTKRWYADGRRGKCFEFKGCAGVPNSFSTKNECLRTCFAIQKLDVCRLRKDPGPCSTPMVRWYYDNDVRECRQFIYSGCHGNSNRFVTRIECETACHRTDPCRLSKDGGDLLKSKWAQRFFFNKTSAKCEHFWYSGSGGNANRFNRLVDCRKTCEVPASTAMSPEMLDQTFTCLQPVWENIPCADGSNKVKKIAYYDVMTKSCKTKEYNVCNGLALTGNRFLTIEQCQQQCEFQEVKVEDRRRCESPKPKKQHFCGKWVSSWFFDAEKGKCISFWYGQCDKDEDMANRFESRASCEKTCIQLDWTTDVNWSTIKIFLDQTTPSTREITATKSGECPRIPDSFLQDETCPQECESDAQCMGIKRCCSTKTEKCKRVAVCLTPTNLISLSTTTPFSTTPSGPACLRSMFGCCPDGETIADDKHLLNCPPLKPTLLEDSPVNITGVFLAESMVLKCNITAAPKAEIDWYHKKFKIPFGSGVYYRRFIKKDFILRISPVQPQDHGQWQCRAKNYLGTASMTFNVNVLAPASLVKMSQSLIRVDENSSVALSCVGQGNPKPIVNWYFSSTANGPQELIAYNRTTYVVSKVNKVSKGYYYCEANNGIKSSLTRNRHRIVLRTKIKLKAEVITYPYDQKVMEGSYLRLQCKVTSAPARSRLYWYRKGRMLDPVTTPGRVQTLLKIRKAKFSDSGSYKCILIDPYGGAKYYSTSIRVYRDSSKLPLTCRDDLPNCDGVIESFGFMNQRSCKGSHAERRCCRTCYEMGKLELSDIIGNPKKSFKDSSP